MSTRVDELAADGEDHDEVRALPGSEARMGPGRMHVVGMPVEKPKAFGESVRRLWALFGANRRWLALALGASVASACLNVVGPRLLGRATDLIVTGVVGDGLDTGELHRVLLDAVALYLCAMVLQFLGAYVLAGVVQRTMFALRAAAQQKLDRLPLAYVDRQSRGDLLSRVTNDIDNIAQSLQQTLSQMLTSVLMLTGVVVMMFTISPLLAVVALVTVPLSILSMRAIASRSRPRFLDQWRTTGELNALVEETFSGHAIVKAYGRQREVEARFRETNDGLFDASFGAQFLSSLLQPVTIFFGNVQYLLIAVVGALRINSGAVTIGQVQAFIQYSRQFSQPLTQFASMMNVFQSGIASLERVLDLLDAEEETPDPPARPLASTRGRVEFHDVSFAYDPSRPLIESLSLVAEPGETIAIVGPTGAGKTTLVNLLMRFYELDGGSITLDGRDIASMSRADLRSNMGMVLQDTWLFGGTIRDNLAYGNPDATDDDILRAARATYVDRFVHSLPQGYDTLINEEADNISAGQKQLLTIARAFLADPAILILDEATSSVDTRTEVLIQEAMNALRRGRTSFVIAHRLSTIRGADAILVMDRGRIVEQGTHAELLALGGRYHDLHMSQFLAAADEPV